MSDEKNYPLHRIRFSEKSIDWQGNERLGKPVEVATIWPRKNGKQGGLLRWETEPKNLKDGVYFLLPNHHDRGQSNAIDEFEHKDHPSHRISFSQKSADWQGNGKLGKPIEVATVWPRKNGKQGGLVDWHLDPASLNDGAYFLLENNRERGQSNAPDQFDRKDQQRSERDPQQMQGNER